MIRDTDHLLQSIASELVWRRKELTELRALIEGLDDKPLRQRVMIRSAVALLYAHWEGFVKKVGGYYVEYVASKHLPYKDLTPNFVALTLRSKFATLHANGKISGGNALADFFCSSLDSRSNIPYKTAIDTKSNLSSTVLSDIIDTLGLDIGDFITRFHFIDSNLVKRRNYIAHGEELSISPREYLEIHEDVLTLIETFRNQVENASALKKYQRIT